ERAKKLFGCDHANVQPLGGANANIAAYFAWMEPGDTILGMDLSHGGHLTHGHPVTIMAKIFNFVRYKMKNIDTGEIDYDELEELAKKHKPKIVLVGASAYSRDYDYARVKEIADSVDAVAMADIAHTAGLIAGGALQNPFAHGFQLVTTTTHKTLRGPRGGMIMCKEEYAKDLDRMVMPGIQGGPLMHVIAAKAAAFKEALRPEFKEYQKRIVDNASAMAQEFLSLGQKLVSGGTDTHFVLLSFIERGLTGKKVEKALDRANITVNKNTVPFDPQKPLVTSGIRIGVPALTTRGMGTEEMKQIANMIDRIINNLDEDSVIDGVRAEVSEVCRRFPLYSESTTLSGLRSS
ncbi:MAG: serine hydroxymethyltransferase, partial [candidate division Zixibacteria bacterium]|nr:serine hydroxymethyltransferase [candidate division Zixibacteria bacterium]